MQRQFQVKPNVITCGALTDSLVKAGRVAETIEVLQYMKNEGIVPGTANKHPYQLCASICQPHLIPYTQAK